MGMKTRYRIHHASLFSKGLLVLQVLKHFPDGPDDFCGLPTYLAHDSWVDATVEDLTEFGMCLNSN